MSKRRVIVTGGCGFIGSNYLHYAVNQYPDEEYICIDSLTYAGNYHNLEPILKKKNFKFIKLDITDRQGIDELFAEVKPDWVINFAAESHVDNSIKHPEVFLKTNILGTQVLMDASLKYKVKRYHQISTDEVYGDLPLDRPDLKFTEETPLHTSSPYSASKASADLLVLAYIRTFGLPATISRCTNNYGPYQFPEKLIPVTIEKMVSGQPVPIYGVGNNVRDWIHVHDHNVGVDLVLRKGKIGEVYNFGGHAEKTNLEVIFEIAKTFLIKNGHAEPKFELVKDRPGHDLRYAIDSSKAERELGWTRSYTFEQGFKETVDWYLNNQKWCDNIKSSEYQTAYK